MEPFARDFDARAFTIGISGRVTSGKRTLLLALCRLLRDTYSLSVVAGQTLPPEDDCCREFLVRHKALAPARLAQVQRDGHPDAAIQSLMTSFRPDLLFLDVDRDESGCDVAGFADFRIHVVDGCGDGVSPGEWLDVVQSDVLVINKTHVGPPIDPDLNEAVRDVRRLRGDATLVFAQVRYGIGVVAIARHFLSSWRQATAPAVPAPQFAAAAATASV